MPFPGWENGMMRTEHALRGCCSAKVGRKASASVQGLSRSRETRQQWLGQRRLAGYQQAAEGVFNAYRPIEISGCRH